MTVAVGLGGPAQAQNQAYLEVVQGYADGMIADGRDVYGEEHSPLFATLLLRNPTRLPEQESWISNGPGLRSHDREMTASNPMHDQNLYQVLYALSAVTGDPKYAEEADAALTYFFTHCQAPETGLMTWGELAACEFYTDAPYERNKGDSHRIHEFYRPWVLWDKTYELTPDEAKVFAKGVWEHQIVDHKSGNFSRHAKWHKHAPAGNNQYPRHGGFYIMTWAQAYRATQDPVYLKAIDVLLGYYERHRSEVTGALPAETGNSRSGNKLFWPSSTVSMSIDLWDAAPYVPDGLALRMREMALKNDEAFIKTKNDLGPDGKGFVVNSDIDTLEAVNIRTNKPHPLYTEMWSTGYGAPSDAEIANMVLQRYRQVTENKALEKIVLAAANRYLTSDAPDKLVYPKPFGDAIELELGAYEITGDPKYLDRAVHFADQAVTLFFDEASPLPKTSSKHNHYEAMTGADTLAMSLLKLWILQNQPNTEVTLIWNDR